MSERMRWQRAVASACLAVVALAGCASASEPGTTRAQPSAVRSSTDPTPTKPPPGTSAPADDAPPAGGAPPADDAPPAGAVSGRCLDGVTRGETLYVRSASARTPQLLTPLDDVVRPGCDDTGGAPGPDTDVTAWSIRGADVEDAVAVVAADGQVTVYVAGADKVTWRREGIRPSAYLSQYGRLTVTSYGSSSCPSRVRSARLVEDGMLRVLMSKRVRRDPGRTPFACTADLAAHLSSVDVDAEIAARQPVVAVLVGAGFEGLAVPVAR